MIYTTSQCTEKQMKNRISHPFYEEHGQTILEYGLIIAVLVLIIIATIPNLRNSIRGVFLKVESSLDNIEETFPHLPEDDEYWNSLPQEDWYNQWYSTNTKLGKGQ